MATGKRRHPHAIGTGPGIITDDGCPVDLWVALPAGDAPAIIHGAIPPAASVLDLGAGVGRLAHPLVSLGHAVVAVDESAAMLAHVRDASCVCSTIEDLALGTTFGVVLLASHLVNTPNHGSRQALLTTCRRHVHDDGQVVLQRYLPGWAEAADGTTSEIADGIVHTVKVVAARGGGRYTLEATSRIGPRQWAQRYTMQELDDAALNQQLRLAGLQLEWWISDDGAWVTAVKHPPHS